jgi:Cu-Zn family superoxide dismutase
MHRLILLLGTLAAAVTLASVQAQAKGGKTVGLKDAKGQSVGTATLTQKGTGVEIKYDLKKLLPGEHAFHIHQNAKCDADP